eukprot:g22700.t1
MSRGAWKRDVVTGHQAMTTTGGSTWDAAFRLCDFLEAEWHGGLTPDGPKAVLELGAGTGWLGMTVARNCPCHVCLTEQAEGGAMEWLQENLAQNVAAGLPLQGVTLQDLGGVNRRANRWGVLGFGLRSRPTDPLKNGAVPVVRVVLLKRRRLVQVCKEGRQPNCW